MVTGVQEPIEERGERIATFLRRGFQGAPDIELRVSLDEFEGKRYASVRQWYDDRGTWKPGKGTSVRMSELRGVAEALIRIADEHQAEQGPAPRQPDRQRQSTAPEPRKPFQPKPEGRPLLDGAAATAKAAVPYKYRQRTPVDPDDEFSEYRR